MYGYVVQYIVVHSFRCGLVLNMWLIVKILCMVQTSNMSDTINFKIYYDQGTVLDGPRGVDLRYFQSAIVSLTRPEQRTWSAVMRWLYYTFELDHTLRDLKLSCLATRSPHGTNWELLQLNGTRSW